jgi:hypothetical protein
MNILNPLFIYTNSSSTDVARHWRDMELAAQEKKAKQWAEFRALLPMVIANKGAEEVVEAVEVCAINMNLRGEICLR